jgi:hypothetical protein
MILEIALTLYVFFGIVTFLVAVSDKYVEISGKLIALFTLLSFIWPIVWVVYLLDS